MITVGQQKARESRAKKKGLNRDVMEGLILSKLYKDGLFVVDEEAKTVTVDARKNHIGEMYGEESYTDVMSVIDKTASGLKINGYTVTVKRIDIVSA